MPYRVETYSFMITELNNIAVIGASGAIGSAFKTLLSDRYPHASVCAFSRHGENPINYNSEGSILKAARHASKDGPLDLVIVSNGILHRDRLMPEKSMKELSAEKFRYLFEANTIIPALIAKYFLPKLNKNRPSTFAALSARVGSISDNRIGGWYAYRASKAALNMIIKSAAIEMGRSNAQAVIVGLHPGTVDSNLSKPFQTNVPDGGLFTPEYSTKKLLDVLIGLKPNQSGQCFSWDGSKISP